MHHHLLYGFSYVHKKYSQNHFDNGETFLQLIHGQKAMVTLLHTLRLWVSKNKNALNIITQPWKHSITLSHKLDSIVLYIAISTGG